jgi:transposase
MPLQLCQQPVSFAKAKDYSVRPMDQRGTLEAHKGLVNKWAGIIQRCYNPDYPAYKWYGARGIGVCERWLNPLNFIVDVGQPPSGMSLDRINNDGDYSPENCRWATREQQNENTRRVKLISYMGKTQSIKQWAKDYNISPPRLSERLRRGWPMSRALATPCPRGYELGRQMHIAESKRQWAAKGKIYLHNSRNPEDKKPTSSVEAAAPCLQLCANPDRRPRQKDDQTCRRKHVKVTAAIREEIMALAAEGKTCRAIAAQVGVSKSSVSLALSRLGLAA